MLGADGTRVLCHLSGCRIKALRCTFYLFLNQTSVLTSINKIAFLYLCLTYILPNKVDQKLLDIILKHKNGLTCDCLEII